MQINNFEQNNMRFITLFLIVPIVVLFNYELYAQQNASDSQLFRLEDSLLRKLKEAKPDTIKTKLILTLINLYQDVQPQKAIEWIGKAKVITLNNKDYDKLLLFITMEMRCKGRLGLFTEALALANQSAYLLNKNVLPKTSAGFFLQKGQLLYKIASYNESAEALNRAAEIANRNKLPDIEIKVLINLTLLMEPLGKYAEMRAQYLKALKIAEKAGLFYNAANIRVNLALLESKSNNNGKAIEYLQEALSYYKSEHNDVSVALCYANLSWAYYQTNDYQKALFNAQESFDIRIRLNDKAGISKLHINLGQVFLEMGKYDSSFKHLEKGITLSKTLSLPQNVRDGYKTLSLLYERTNQYESAYQSLQKHHEWKDSVFKLDKEKQLLQQLNIYKSKYSDSLVLQKEAFIIKQKQSINYLWGALAGIILLFIAGVVRLFHIKKQAAKVEAMQVNPAEVVIENKQLKQQIEKLNEELHILQANLKTGTNEDLINLRKLVSESSSQAEGYWNEFLLLFCKIYPQFFDQLKSNYPQLTQTELRICTLMKLSLSLLEIANLLNITVEGARKARYRIYKKMELASDKELSEKLLML
jgi:tetratricopeptide (TPR) repeat protein